MASFFDRFRPRGDRQPARPYSEQGVSGYAVSGGYIVSPETNSLVMGTARWRTASDILANTSIVASGLRYFLNLIARPEWSFEPANDTAEAKAMAEFMESVIEGIDSSWTRIIRRSGIYKFHGFNMAEWVAKKRDEDGRIGIASIEQRPAHTIEKWDMDANGGVTGVWQRAPVDGREIFLPRRKLMYLVDDTLTDRPDGMGFFRHLVEPNNRLKAYLKLEAIGFQRDLVGVPVGRAPLHKLNKMVDAGEITAEQRDAMISGLKDFVRLESKGDRTGLVLSSQTYIGKSEQGEQISQVPEWGMELLKGEQGSIEHLAAAIKRLDFDMAAIMGVESLLTGREGEGSRALSEDKSKNLYLTANATLADMRETVDRDLVMPIWAMNGLPEELRPRAKTEDVAFKDAAEVAAVLRDMATAGAILAPDDEAIDDVRNLMGISPAKQMTPEELALARGGPVNPPDPTKPPPVDPNKQPPPRGGGGPNPPKGQDRAEKYDPDQPRAPRGSSIGGRWISGGGGVEPLTPDTKAKLVAANAGKDIEQIRVEALENQKAIHAIGEDVERELGIEFRPPPPGFEVKTADSIARKVRDEGYDGPHALTDVSRASFVLDDPAEADAVIDELSRRGTVYDRGWKRLPESGYLDRKIYVAHPNGGVSEVQLVPRGVHSLKMGLGHKLYEVARLPSTPLPAARAANRKQRRLYAKTIRTSHFRSVVTLGGRP